MKSSIKNRINQKSNVSPSNEVATKTVNGNEPANPRLTYALYNANRAASKINGCEVFNDWHKQGLTVAECNELIASYNKVTGYVYKPKSTKKEKETGTKRKQAKKVASKDISKELSGINPDDLKVLLAMLAEIKK